MTAPAFAQPGLQPADAITRHVSEVIRRHDSTRPRSVQTAVGPSEIGHPCPRRLAYKLTRTTPTNGDTDPWAAIVGTSVHAWLADAFTAENQRLGRTRYYVETPVRVDDELTIPGTCDLYDTDTRTVIDWKVVGTTALRKYKAEGPRPVYRAQAHLYGRGFALMGEPVEHVALVFYSRAGFLAHTHTWTEPYDQARADAALARYASIAALAGTVHPEHIPATPDDSCTWCPFWAPATTDLALGCPGATS